MADGDKITVDNKITLAAAVDINKENITTNQQTVIISVVVVGVSSLKGDNIGDRVIGRRERKPLPEKQVAAEKEMQVAGGAKEVEMKNKEEAIKEARIPKLRPREISLMQKSQRDLGRGGGKCSNIDDSGIAALRLFKLQLRVFVTKSIA